MSIETELNEYLLLEFGLDDDDGGLQPSDSWPFQLRPVGRLGPGDGPPDTFAFACEGESFFALSADALNFMPQAGMSFNDLVLQSRGARWISSRDPVDNHTSMIGTDVPSTLQRRAAIDAMAAALFRRFRVHEGLYLRRESSYLALVEDLDTTTYVATGPLFPPTPIGFPGASSWRRLSIAVALALSLTGEGHT